MTIEEMACRVTVRWWDGYIETFDATEVRAGAYMLYIKFNDDERRIPLQQVRWYKFNHRATCESVCQEMGKKKGGRINND